MKSCPILYPLERWLPTEAIVKGVAEEATKDAYKVLKEKLSKLGVIVESVPKRTLRIVPQPVQCFWDGDEFMDGIYGRVFG
jgi:hypothetical protein